MAETSKPIGEVLADLTAFRADGPSVLFVRPRRPLSKEEERNVLESNYQISRGMRGSGVTFVLLPHDFDVMAVGDAELRKLGLARIPTETSPASDFGLRA